MATGPDPEAPWWPFLLGFQQFHISRFSFNRPPRMSSLRHNFFTENTIKWRQERGGGGKKEGRQVDMN